MGDAIDFLDERLPDRFWKNVQPCPMSGCWLWVCNAGIGSLGDDVFVIANAVQCVLKHNGMQSNAIED